MDSSQEIELEVGDVELESSALALKDRTRAETRSSERKHKKAHLERKSREAKKHASGYKGNVDE
ncbi:hypothetical protein AB4254_13620 [Vibrio breoganii]